MVLHVFAICFVLYASKSYWRESFYGGRREIHDIICYTGIVNLFGVRYHFQEKRRKS